MGLVGATTYKAVSFYTIFFIIRQTLGYKYIFHFKHFGFTLYIDITTVPSSNYLYGWEELKITMIDYYWHKIIIMVSIDLL